MISKPRGRVSIRLLFVLPCRRHAWPFHPLTPFCISTLSWGRWKDILTHGRFKWHLNEKDMEMICRALLVYCVKHYKGDEKIKSFIWELITPTKDGQAQTLQNHSGEGWHGP